jgi:hypothetical protein
VFARLPLQSLIRLRLLSKEWNADLSSRAFQLAFCDGRPRGFAVVETERTGPKRVWAYDARARTWHGLPLGYLPFSYLVAADGGLLCFAKYGKADERLQLVVCNPLTCTWRELPPAVGVQMIPKALHMKVDMASRQYTIKFLGTYTPYHVNPIAHSLRSKHSLKSFVFFYLKEINICLEIFFIILYLVLEFFIFAKPGCWAMVMLWKMCA